ncbi:MAG TPA: NUDIX domain-containing protein [Polyangiaceae bacterium]|nr:NUDIX domain-containing protein [Polyangiaceae bacterium]
MAKQSAGLVIYRARGGELEVLLVHPGGPFFKNKDDGSWSIPKGEFASGEEPLLAARRELEEETGLRAEGPFAPLGNVTQRGGKVVIAFACAGDFDLTVIKSNRFEIEWPPRSGRRASFPEIDRAEYFALSAARVKINQGQLPLLDRLAAALA